MNTEIIKKELSSSSPTCSNPMIKFIDVRLCETLFPDKNDPEMQDADS
jgi:hypothetical protein